MPCLSENYSQLSENCRELSENCRQLSENCRQLSEIAVNYRNCIYPQWTMPLKLPKPLIFRIQRVQSWELPSWSLHKKTWVLAMATKPSWSCETLQHGATLLGKNAEGTQDQSDLDQLIRVFWLHDQTCMYIFCILPMMLKIFTLKLRSIPLRLNKRRLPSWQRLSHRKAHQHFAGNLRLLKAQSFGFQVGVH